MTPKHCSSVKSLRPHSALCRNRVDTLRACGEEEVVRGVPTLFARVVQVYHRLHVVEEEEKGRKVEQEVEREDQGEETVHMDGHEDDMKDSNLSHGACMCGDE